MSGEQAVATAAGLVRGDERDGVHVFRGVPYGASTSGSNRFRPPQPPVPWDGIRDCTTFGPECPQPSFEISDLVGTAPAPSGEDCLSLNVYTPGLDDGARPVMVWFHGGGFTIGTGNTYDGTRLAGRNDVVVVTVNHRLGFLGYLNLAQVDGDYADSGNASTLDMIAALEWVRDNATAFGGDPGTVTIFGESGGGGKVCSLLASPRAAGLFHRAIIQSGPLVRAVEPDNAAGLTAKLMAQVGATSVDDLVALSVDDLLAAQNAVLPTPLGGTDALGPARDGRTITQHPYDPVASETAARVPVLIGTCRDEMALFLAGTDPEAVDDAALLVTARDLFGADAERAIDVYRAARPHASRYDLQVAMESDRLRIPSIHIAERIRRAGGVAYMFRFDFTSPLFDRRYAPHYIEVPFVFDQIDGDLGLKLHGDRDDAQPLADAISRAWAAFARSGDPNHDGLPEWPAYDEQRRATMLLDVECGVVDDPAGDERAVWPEYVKVF